MGEQACLQNQAKQATWVEKVAVGSEAFVLGVKEEMGMSVLGGKVNLDHEIYTLREPESACNAHFDRKKGGSKY